MAFCPTGNTVNVVGAATSANVQLTAFQRAGKRRLRLVNAGTVTLFWKTGTSNAVAAVAANDNAIAAGAAQEVYLPDGQTWIAAIGAAGSTLYATTGVDIDG